jgi:hypothetical protein
MAVRQIKNTIAGFMGETIAQAVQCTRLLLPKKI